MKMRAIKTLVILCIMVALFPVFPAAADIQASAKELGARHFGMFICWSLSKPLSASICRKELDES